MSHDGMSVIYISSFSRLNALPLLDWSCKSKDKVIYQNKFQDEKFHQL